MNARRTGRIMQETTVIESRRPGQNERQKPPCGPNSDLADGVVRRGLSVHQVVIDRVADAAVGTAVRRVALTLPGQQRGVPKLLAQGTGPFHGGSRITGGSNGRKMARALVFLTDAFGGKGGIAQFNRDLRSLRSPL